MTSDRDFLREQLIALLPTGRNFAISAKQLARELGTTTRVVGQLVEEAIETDGYVIGSACTEPVGYFLIVDEADLEVGCGHIVARAAASFKRVRALERNYAAMNQGQSSLFAEFSKAVGA